MMYRASHAGSDDALAGHPAGSAVSTNGDRHGGLFTWDHRLLSILRVTAVAILVQGLLFGLLFHAADVKSVALMAAVGAAASGALAWVVAGGRVGAMARAREGQERLFLLSLDLLCVTGFDGCFNRLNPTWERTLGWTPEELLARPYLEFVHPDDRVATMTELGKIRSGDITVSFENRYRCKDNTYRWLEWMAASSTTQSLTYMVARDRTEQKKTEDEAQRTKLFLDSIFENIPNMIFVKDAGELRFVRFNRAGEELLGYSRNDLIGKNDFDFFPKEQAEFFVCKDREVLRGKVLVDVPEEPLQTKEKGLRYLHTKKVPLLDEHGEPQYLLGISEDITDQKRLEDVKSEFIALASHQLRTPLTTIRWTLELLQEQADAPAPARRRLVAEAYEGALRMVDTIRTMLRASHLDSQILPVHCCLVDLRPLLDGVCNNFNHICAMKGQELTITCSAGLAVRTDPELLAEVLSNLLDNAVKYTPEGGTVRVAVQRTSDVVSIAVSDTGCGIPRNEQDRVFTKLFRATNAVAEQANGTGLGLYVAARLMDLLGGTLTFVSEQHRGTTFTLRVPTSTPIHHG